MRIATVLCVAGQPRFLNSRIVVVVVVIDAYDRIATLKQPQNECGADKASSASDKDFQDLRTVSLDIIMSLLMHVRIFFYLEKGFQHQLNKPAKPQYQAQLSS